MTYAENEPLTSWLAQESPEEVLEPELPIIDPHHHIWQRPGWRYCASGSAWG